MKIEYPKLDFDCEDQASWDIDFASNDGGNTASIQLFTANWITSRQIYCLSYNMDYLKIILQVECFSDGTVHKITFQRGETVSNTACHIIVFSSNLLVFIIKLDSGSD